MMNQPLTTFPTSLDMLQNPLGFILNEQGEQLTHQPSGDTLNCSSTIFDIELKSVPRNITHKEMLGALLNELSEINFQELANLSDGESLKRQHYVIIPIEQLLKVAKKNFWSLAMSAGQVYSYNGSYWKELTKEELQNFLGVAAEKFGVRKYESRYHSFRADLLKQFYSTAYLPRPEKNGEEVLINLKNGTFVITPFSHLLRPFDRKDFLTHQLPFEYNPDATAPLFKKYLDTVLPDLQQQLILSEFVAYVFIKQKTLKLEKSLILYGGGSNGKSVFFEIIIAMLGSENVSNFSLEALTNQNGYYRAKIANKLLNYASEISPKMDTTIFKQLASGEPVEARLPYGDPMMLVDYSKFIFNTNSLPQNVEQTEAFFRRFIILHFGVTISEDQRDPELSKKIIRDELPGVFNWALEGLERLLSQRKFSKSTVADQMVQQYKIQSDSVQLFISEEGYTTDLNHEITLKSLFNDYKNYCTEFGYKSCSLKIFSERLRNQGYNIHRKGAGNVVDAIKKFILN